MEEKIIDSAIQKDIYGNLPISVIEWLELSSSLFLQLKNQCNNYNEAAVLSLFYVINNSDNKDLCKLKYFLKDKHYQSMLNKINNNFEIENDIIGDQLDVYVMDKKICSKWSM